MTPENLLGGDLAPSSPILRTRLELLPYRLLSIEQLGRPAQGRTDHISRGIRNTCSSGELGEDPVDASR